MGDDCIPGRGIRDMMQPEAEGLWLKAASYPWAQGQGCNHNIIVGLDPLLTLFCINFHQSIQISCQNITPCIMTVLKSMMPGVTVYYPLHHDSTEIHDARGSIQARNLNHYATPCIMTALKSMIPGVAFWREIWISMLPPSSWDPSYEWCRLPSY